MTEKVEWWSCIADRPIRADELVHVVIVREDLPVGVAAAMIVHASGESGPAEPGTIAVVLGVEDVRQLIEYLALVVGEVEYLSDIIEIEESDPPWDGALMAFALRPRQRRDLPRCLRTLKLYSGPKEVKHVP